MSGQIAVSNNNNQNQQNNGNAGLDNIIEALKGQNPSQQGNTITVTSYEEEVEARLNVLVETHKAINTAIAQRESQNVAIANNANLNIAELQKQRAQVAERREGIDNTREGISKGKRVFNRVWRIEEVRDVILPDNPNRRRDALVIKGHAERVLGKTQQHLARQSAELLRRQQMIRREELVTQAQARREILQNQAMITRGEAYQRVTGLEGAGNEVALRSDKNGNPAGIIGTALRQHENGQNTQHDRASAQYQASTIKVLEKAYEQQQRALEALTGAKKGEIDFPQIVRVQPTAQQQQQADLQNNTVVPPVKQGGPTTQPAPNAEQQQADFLNQTLPRPEVKTSPPASGTTQSQATPVTTQALTEKQKQFQERLTSAHQKITDALSPLQESVAETTSAVNKTLGTDPNDPNTEATKYNQNVTTAINTISARLQKLGENLEQGTDLEKSRLELVEINKRVGHLMNANSHLNQAAQNLDSGQTTHGRRTHLEQATKQLGQMAEYVTQALVTENLAQQRDFFGAANSKLGIATQNMSLIARYKKPAPQAAPPKQAQDPAGPSGSGGGALFN